MASKSSNLPNDRLLLIAFLLSGFVALGYEMVWTRLLALVLGGELLGVLGVLAGFFIGMVIGAFTLSQHARRTANPVNTFMILELIIAMYGLASPFLIYELSDAVPVWLGPVAGDNDSPLALLISLLVSSVVLLPATFGMGANFAYLAEAQRRVLHDRSADKSLSRIYAANTFGATLGTLAAVYWIVPTLGFAWACAVFSFAGLVAILVALLWDRGAETKLTAISNSIKSDQSKYTDQSKYFGLLFVTGLTAIGLEIVVIHLLKQILENTIFTFANILSIFLVGTAIGSWLYQFVGARTDDDWLKKIPSQIFLGLLVAIVISFGMLAASPGILDRWSAGDANHRMHMIIELWIATLVFLLPTIFMGALFTFLISRVAPENLGKAYAINTFGAALAPFVFGLGMIPWIGPFSLLAIVWFCYWIIFGIGVYALKWRNEFFMLGGIPLMFLVFGLFSQPDLIQLPKGAVELQREEGLMGTVVVSERKNMPPGPLGLPHRVLQVNNQFRMGGGAGFLERRMGNLPLLLSRERDAVLFLGIGSGTTIGVCRDHGVKEITAVEIVPQVKDVLHWFKEHSNNIFENDGMSYHASDARRFVSATKAKYDVVVCDLYHPARDGAGLLYTLEHFEKLSSLLNENGLLCQWIPAHQFDREGLAVVLRSFQKVFTNCHAFLAGYNTRTVALGLIATNGKFEIDLSRLNSTISNKPSIQRVYENGNDLFSTYLFSGNDLAEMISVGPLNTDLHPVILFDAPKSVYVPEQQKARNNLRWILNHRKLWPESIVSPPVTEQTADSLKSMWQASGLFLESKMLEDEGRDPESWEKLVKAYKIQPDFSAARGRLFVTAMQDQRRRAQIMRILTERDRQRLIQLMR